MREGKRGIVPRTHFGNRLRVNGALERSGVDWKPLPSNSSYLIGDIRNAQVYFRMEWITP